MNIREYLLEGQAIPACPLALDENRRFDERHQRALARYYVASGAGGLAVAVHSTQFEIRESQHALLRPVLELVSQTIDEALVKTPRPFLKVSGVCGGTEQAVAEAQLSRELGYHAALLSLSAFKNDTVEAMLAHSRAVAQEIPIIGFYLQPSVGGRILPYEFWREFVEIENVVAIKMAPFNRFQTIDVVRAVVDSGREDVALYTGNDDNIVIDLLTKWQFERNGKKISRQIVGGLLGHWAVWTHNVVGLLEEIKTVRKQPTLDAGWLTRAVAVTDCNAAFFDPAHDFAGCIPGIHEVLRRQGLLKGTWCLNPQEVLSPGQSEEIDRVFAAYPELNDDAFVKEHLDEWLQ